MAKEIKYREGDIISILAKITKVHGTTAAIEPFNFNIRPDDFSRAVYVSVELNDPNVAMKSASYHVLDWVIYVANDRTTKGQIIGRATDTTNWLIRRENNSGVDEVAPQFMLQHT